MKKKKTENYKINKKIINKKIKKIKKGLPLSVVKL
jgi:hypothetical protein